jgi:hypothetical protein
MGMDMTRIDTVQAFSLEPGDVIERWVEDDSEEGRYTIETVTKVEDDGTDVLIYTEEMEDPEVPWAVDAFDEMNLFGYPQEEV